MINKIGRLGDEIMGPGKSPAGSSGGASGSSGGNKSPSSVSITISQPQKDIVRTMQNVMSDLSMQIIKNALTIHTGKQIFQSADELRAFAGTFGNTAMGNPGSAAGDGIWGSNTQKALNQVISFVEKMKLQGITIVSGPKYNEAKDDVIIKNATANIDNLSKIFEQLRLQAPAEAKRKLSNKLDDVGKDLGKEQAFDPLRAPFPSSIPVFKDNIETLLRFFDFVSINQMKVSGVNCQPLAQKAPVTPKKKLESDDPWANKDSSKAEDGLYENIAYSVAFWDNSNFYKLAEQIKNSHIIRVAGNPEDQANNTDPDLGAVEQRTFSTGICLNQFEQLIYWFATRANSLANALYNLIQSGDINPITKQTVTQAEVDAAVVYNKMTQGLYNQWVRVKKAIEKVIIESGDSNNPVISRDMIEGNLYSGSNQPGAARTRPGSGGNSGVQSYTTPGATDGDQGGIGLDAGPISNYMDFDALKDRGFTLDSNGEDSLARLASHDVNIKDWTGQSGTTWQTLAVMYSKESSEVGKIEDIQNITRNISNVIISFYNNWKTTQKPPTEVSQGQFELAKKWTNALRSMSAAALRQTSETGGGGRGQMGSYPVSKRR
jgi:hypothetical protein